MEKGLQAWRRKRHTENKKSIVRAIEKYILETGFPPDATDLARILNACQKRVRRDVNVLIEQSLVARVSYHKNAFTLPPHQMIKILQKRIRGARRPDFKLKFD